MAVAFLASDTLLSDYYRIVNPMTIGRTSTIYLATHTEIPHHKFGIRLLHPEYSANEKAVNRFRQGVMSLLQISHLGVLRPYDFVQTHGLVGIGMEFVDGVSLTHVMRTHRLSPELKLSLLLKVCESVSAAHSVGVVHCNIGPRHVMVTRSQQVKLIDFSSARIVSEPEMCENSNVLLRPSRYTSPEQRAGLAGDFASDIYSLGAVAFELFCGEPFEGDLRGLARGRKNAPRELGEVLLKALMPRPTSRYETVLEFQKRLREAGAAHSDSTSGRRSVPKNQGLSRKRDADATVVVGASLAKKRLRIPPIGRFVVSGLSSIRSVSAALRERRKAKSVNQSPVAERRPLARALVVMVLGITGFLLTAVLLFQSAMAGGEPAVIDTIGQSASEQKPRGLKKVADSGPKQISAQLYASETFVRELASALDEASDSLLINGSSNFVRVASGASPVSMSSSKIFPRRQEPLRNKRHDQHRILNSLAEPVQAKAEPRQSSLDASTILKHLQEELAGDEAGANCMSSDNSETGVEDLLLEAGSLNNPLLTRILIDFTQSHSYTVRIAALKALRSQYYLSFPETLEAIERGLADEDYLVRGFAVKSLAEAEGDFAQTRLMEQLDSERHPIVRMVIEIALTQRCERAQA